MTRSNTPGVDKKTAWCDERRFREVCARQPRLAEQVASLILRRQEDGRLQWYEDGRVRVKTATLAKTGHRQLRPMAKRIYIKPLVERILDAIRLGKEDDLVSWHHDEVFVNTTTIFPKGSAVRMTLEGRRKRLRDAVAGVLLKEGWERLGNDCFRRKENEG